MIRISRHELYMGTAKLAAKRSTCMRLNVGAVIVKDRNILSIGYNGAPAGEPHCSADTCSGRSPCTRTIHAEMNALTRLPAGTEGPLDLYLTDSPCCNCYDRLVSDRRVRRIFFDTPYRNTSHLEDNLLTPLIQVYRLLPAGYLMDWDSGELVDVEI